MTVATLIQLIFAALVIITGLDWLRQRDRVRLDIWLLFVCLTVPALLPALAARLGITLLLVDIVAVLAVLVQPWLLLRVVQHFRPVPRLVRALVLAGLFGILVVLFALGESNPAVAVVLLEVYFLIAEGYSIWAFWQAARASGGVVRRRLALATAGSVMLSLALIFSGIMGVVPRWAALAREFTELSTLLAAVAYYLSFATPRPLRRAWQLAELYRFQAAPAGPPTTDRMGTVLEQLAAAASRTTGSRVSAAWLWDREQARFTLRAADPPMPQAVAPRMADGPLGQAWTERRPVLAERSAALGAAPSALASPAVTVLAVPVAANDRAWGVLETYFERHSLFPEDDLALLALLAAQAAETLEREALAHAERLLVDQLAQANAELQAEVVERRQAEASLAQRTAETEALARSLETVIENIPAMLFMKDAAELRFVRWNKACEQVVGLPRADALGKNDYDFFPAAEAEFFTARDREVLLSGQLLDIPEETIHTVHQGVRVLHTRKVPIVDAAGRPQYLLGISEDITEQRQTEAQIRQLNESLTQRAALLEAANQELEAFSYSVSHDLRAPLRSIDGFSLALLEDYEAKLDAQGQDYLQRIRRAAQRMAQLIDDLLRLAWLSRATVTLDVVDLSSLAWTVLGELRAIEPEREVETVVAEGLTVMADARLLRVALENLLGNAWKFTSRQPAARIEVSTAPLNGQPVFCVRDNGAGFDHRSAERLFGAFQRMHTLEEFPGTGIGLAIVQRIIQRHGGRIWAESAPGEGAAFYFAMSGEGGM